MKIILAAGRRHGIKCLEEIIEQGHEVVGVFGLREHLHENVKYTSELETLTSENQISYFPEKKLHDTKSAQLVKSLSPDFMLVVKWRRIIGREVYKIPKLGTAIIHDSLLPKYRGFAPLNWAIINGETSTGATMFYIAEEMDAGPVIAQKEISIGDDDTIKTMDGKMVEVYKSLLRKSLAGIASHKITAIEQNESLATFCASRTPSDGIINWSESASNIYNLIRGTSWPFPGAYTYFNGKKVIIWSAGIVSETDDYVGRIPGRVIKLLPSGGVWVLTGKGIIEIKTLQSENEAEINASELVRSIRSKFYSANL